MPFTVLPSTDAWVCSAFGWGNTAAVNMGVQLSLGDPASCSCGDLPSRGWRLASLAPKNVVTLTCWLFPSSLRVPGSGLLAAAPASPHSNCSRLAVTSGAAACLHRGGGAGMEATL